MRYAGFHASPEVVRQLPTMVYGDLRDSIPNRSDGIAEGAREHLLSRLGELRQQMRELRPTVFR